MIDLHLHLDGSLTPEFVLRQGALQQIPLPANTPEALRPYLTVPENCPDLNTYLKCFDLPLSVLQTADSLASSVYELLQILAAEGVSYTEIRFAPQLHCRNGLSQEAVTEVALSGLTKGMKDFPIKAGLILCCMRFADNQKANFETVQTARTYIGKGVAALDLAGAEGLFPTENFVDIFRQANKWDIPYTIHAGEAAGPLSIRQALQLGATRIGHGVRCMEDPLLLEELIHRQIPLEVCPISNLQTKVFPDIKHHPILQLLDMGVCVTVNTDNRMVSDTCLAKEYDLLRTHLGMTDNQYDKLQENARKSAFSILSAI